MAEYLRKRYSVGLRRICGRLQMARSTMYYESQGREDEALREALKETAIKRRRWGYRMLSLILGRRGFRDNHKRIYRIYREEGLSLRSRLLHRSCCSSITSRGLTSLSWVVSPRTPI